MADQFAEYVSATRGERFVVSRGPDDTPPGRIRIFSGSRSTSFAGITFHYPGRWRNFPTSNYSKLLSAITELGVEADVPVLWVGEYVDNPTPSDYQELGKLRTTPDGFDVTSEEMQLKDSIEPMWEHFDVDTSRPDRGKSFTDEPVDGFHEFMIDQLGLTTIDLDLVALDRSGSPIGLVEIKRSFNYDIEDWYPFVGEGGDKPNYRLQIAAAEETSTVPYVLTQPGAGYLGGDDTVYLYDLFEDDQRIVRDRGRPNNPTMEDSDLSYSRVRCTAREAMDSLLRT